MEYELTGTVVSIIYQSADGYAVIEVEGEEPTICVGNMPDIKVGELTRFFGVYKTHARYGHQFAVSSYESTLPKDLNDMAAFLGGGFIKGLGEVLARRIVEEFGEKTFDIIEREYHQLANVRGVSKKLAENIHAAFLDYATQKFAYSDLMGMGLSAKQATNCVTEFGLDAAKKIRENPYLLAERIYGIDFVTADKIAQGLGVEKNDPFRIKNGLLNVLKKMLANGHLYVRREKIVPHVATKLGISEGEVKHQLLLAAYEDEVILKKYFPSLSAVFLPQAHNTEWKCAVTLFSMTREKERDEDSEAEVLLQKQSEQLKLTEEQKEAVLTAVKNSVCVITGGPGTGKTTILKAVLNVMGGMGLECALCAPTGRAAKRMQETTGQDAQTLHRLLEYSYDEDAYQCYFRRNEENPLDADVIIVDEVSMIDIFLFYKLLIALREGARLVLVGDADQLPSVGPGNVMGDIIESGVVPTVRLTHRFRNAGGIAEAAYDILNGKMPQFDETSFMFRECVSKKEMIAEVCSAYEQCCEAGEEVQVIAPIKMSETGTIALNQAIRERINPPERNKAEQLFGDKLFREGDRVMQIKNNYAKEWENHKTLSRGEGVFNGDIGVILHIRAGVVEVLFEDGKLCQYDTTELAELDGAFAYTIHKSQGSEFDVILLPMLYEPNPFFARNLLYTAVTRAKSKVVIFGSKRVLDYMVGNYRPSIRATTLSRELRYLNRLVKN